ncbi:MAG TPA: hypothetical protein VLL52_00075 [Anaerolineae bacterium]|nr:hypothetical protein [Anaerolineae bacterium]
MTVSVSIFFNAPHSLAKTVTELGQIWNLSFELKDYGFSSIYETECMGQLVQIEGHDYDNDKNAGIAFEDYQYLIRVSTYKFKGYRIYLCRIGLFLGLQMFHQLQWESMVVYDVQTKIADINSNTVDGLSLEQSILL